MEVGLGDKRHDEVADVSKGRRKGAALPNLSREHFGAGHLALLRQHDLPKGDIILSLACLFDRCVNIELYFGQTFLFANLRLVCKLNDILSCEVETTKSVLRLFQLGLCGDCCDLKRQSEREDAEGALPADIERLLRAVRKVNLEKNTGDNQTGEKTVMHDLLYVPAIVLLLLRRLEVLDIEVDEVPSVRPLIGRDEGLLSEGIPIGTGGLLRSAVFFFQF